MAIAKKARNHTPEMFDNPQSRSIELQLPKPPTHTPLWLQCSSYSSASFHRAHVTHQHEGDLPHPKASKRSCVLHRVDSMLPKPWSSVPIETVISVVGFCMGSRVVCRSLRYVGGVGASLRRSKSTHYPSPKNFEGLQHVWALMIVVLHNFQPDRTIYAWDLKSRLPVEAPPSRGPIRKAEEDDENCCVWAVSKVELEVRAVAEGL